MALAAALAGSCGARSVPELACPAGQTACGGACATPGEDPQNCGACGNVCPQGTVCYAGACATSCGGGTTQCGQSCFDTRVDPHHCGGCDVACPYGTACVQGACTSTCASGQTLCTPTSGAYCASTGSDNANCGACGDACPVGLVCANGACGHSCATGQLYCGADSGAPYCANTSSDNANCGACSVACPVGQTCTSGLCATKCAAGLTLCGMECVDTTSDIGHCGACATACNEGIHSQCTESRCFASVAYSSQPTRVVKNGPYGAVYWTDSTYGLSWVMPSGYPSGTVTTSTGDGDYGLTLAGGVLVWAENTTNRIESNVPGSQQMTPLVTGEGTGLKGLVGDGAAIYWGNDNVIRVLPSQSTSPTNLAAFTAGVQDLALDSTNVYWVDGNNVGAISRSQSDGGAGTILAPASASHAVAVDALFVYWATYNTIQRVLKSGGSTSTVATWNSGIGSIALDAVYVYFTSGGSIERVPVGGGTVETVLSATVLGFGGSITNLAFDNDAIYFGAAGTLISPGIYRLSPK